MTDLLLPISQRTWKVQVGPYSSDELDVAFEVEKSEKHEPNTCSLRVWNLPRDARAQLESLSLLPKQSGLQSGRIRVVVEAGYLSTGSSIIFRGDLRTARTVEEGADLVTIVEGEDGGRRYLQAEVSESFPAGSPYSAAVLACVKALGLGPGNLTSALAYLPSLLEAGTQLDGWAAPELTRLLRAGGLTWSVQNGVLQVRRQGQPVTGRGVLLGPSTNLIGAPQRSATGTVLVRTLIVPDLVPGARVSFALDSLRGVYRVSKIRYSGDTTGNDWFADLECKPL